MQLATLVAEYVREVDGADDVLRDALLERGRALLPRSDELVARLEGVFDRLPAAAQVAIASARVRSLHLNDPALRALVSAALDAVDADPVAAAPETLRNGLFAAWKPATGVDRRIVWAAWMVLRGSPTTALATARAIHAAELEVQISVIAEAFARDLA